MIIKPTKCPNCNTERGKTMMSKNTERIIKGLEKEYKGKVLRKCEWEAILKDALKKYVLTQIEPEEKADIEEIVK